jgi:mannose-6-phosphate isomerase-like protein (cupin superfamily)
MNRISVAGITLNLLLLFPIGGICANTIQVQTMQMHQVNKSKVFKEELLHGEIADTRIEHIVFVGPISKKMVLPKDSSSMFVFIKGNASMKADTKKFDLVPESIALPFSCNEVIVYVPKGETLHFVLFTKKLSDQDKVDLKSFPVENKYDLYFTKFIDCEPYTEKIKSPNTISRTVLPADILPRVSLGTVEVKGPDAVGAHEHPMLDQLFLGLAGNDIVVHANDKSTELKEFSLLHIPLGSSHWATVGESKKMYYLWMDFFMTKEGQEWLKTHKPISKKMN